MESAQHRRLLISPPFIRAHRTHLTHALLRALLTLSHALLFSVAALASSSVIASQADFAQILVPADPPGFDRSAYLQQLGEALIDFFDSAWE